MHRKLQKFSVAIFIEVHWNRSMPQVGPRSLVEDDHMYELVAERHKNMLGNAGWDQLIN